MATSDRRIRKKSFCQIKSKTIYILVKTKIESIELSPQCGSDDVQDVLRAACGASRRDIIKLRNNQNVILPLNPSCLEPNFPSQPYHVEVISCCPQLYTTLLSQGARISLQQLDLRLGNIEKKIQSFYRGLKDNSSNQISELESRVKFLQHQFHRVHTSRQLSQDTRSTVRIRDSSENVARCTACPYFTNIYQMQQQIHLSDMTPDRESPNINWSRIIKSHNKLHNMWIQYQSFQTGELSRSIRESLKLTTFNMWGFSDIELIYLVRYMFIHLQLTTKFLIPISTLDRWLFSVYQNYNCVPFHNFTHAFCVAQMLFSFIHMANLTEIFDDLEILALMFSALSHDLDHPGLNNSFQLNARTSLAQRYNDQSPLENHHCAMAFQLVEDDDKNILKSLTDKQFKRLRDITIRCVLGTDMTKHNEILNEFKGVLSKLDLKNESYHRMLLMVLIIKACDISNEVRPSHISELWVEKLLEEFFQQSDLEKKRCLPWAPFMDREKATKSNSQCGFIKFVILPLFEILGEIFPSLDEGFITPVKSQLEYYTKLQAKPPSSGNDSSSGPLTIAVLPPVRKISAGSYPTRKSSTGSISSRQAFSASSEPLTNNYCVPSRKTSTGSLPSRKSSTGSLVAALS